MVNRYHVILIIASIVGLLSLAAVIALIVIWLTFLTPFQDYALVIDAGSTHSTIFLYTWPADKSDGLGVTSRVSQVKSCDVDGGPVSTIDITIQDNVKQYFDSAMTDCINSIPLTRRSRTLIFLGATAGLRVIQLTNPSYVSSLISGIRSYFSTLGLLFRAPESQVRIIDGSEEGLSGWITANILARQLYENNKPLETYGVLDMGGASTQISFIAPDATSERYTMNLFDTNYDVYSHSYLCYGQQQTRYSYIGRRVNESNGALMTDDPCLPSGYIQNLSYSPILNTPCSRGQYVSPVNFTTATNITLRGTGNYSRCETLMFQRFNKTCSLSNCGFDNVYQPVPNSALNFFAFSAFYSTFNTLASYIPVEPDSDGNYNLASTNLTQISTAIEKVCNQPWSNLSNPDLQYRPFLCFFSMYQWTLLKYGYSMTDANIKRFRIVRMINSNEIGWTLGYMINQTNYLDAEYRPTRLITREEFIGIIVCFLVILVTSIIIIIITIICCKRRQKSRQKYYS